MSTLNLENIKHPDSASNNISVDSSGNVGVGTSPIAPLTVKTATNRNLSVTTNGIGNLNDANSAWQETQFNGNPIIFGSGQFGTERMRIDSAGRVTMPYQPSFYVKNMANDANGAGNFLRGGTVLSSRGGVYDSGTGRFTAPVTGAYVFMAFGQLYGSGGTNYVDVRFRLNGTIVSTEAVVGYGGTFNNHNQVYNQIILELSANDYVDVWTGRSVRNADQNAFMGHLIG